ncbi:sarcosine oxidase subunit gamma family protein [Agrobacterium sp. LAD9]|uniref:sarcosine oxidase subunit gamma family protein n=1 Tax=Agrobacterium sp. LAD9 TaxID=2055153 RepID=UPI000D1E9BE8|nr:sarcosine oxidase subunit gamma family protein [Agrobacterium sp. LAD9]
MSEFRVTLRPALAAQQPIITGGVSLRALPEGHVIHVLGKPCGAAIDATLALLGDGSPGAVRAAGPGQWFIVGNTAKNHAELAALLDALQPSAFGVDQSHGRVRMLVNGSMVERVLAKGTAVDLSLAVFPVGRATTTLIGHIAAHITRVDDDAFEIMVLRSFAASLWDDLARMCAGFA